MSVNKVILVGNVGREPSFRFVEGRQLAEFSLATSEPGYTSRDGVKMPERTEWHNIVVWDRLAQTAERYVHKGTKLFVEGKLRTRHWEDRNTIKHTITEICADNFDILSQPRAETTN